MFFEKEIVRNKSLSPLQAELDYMEQQVAAKDRGLHTNLWMPVFVLGMVHFSELSRSIFGANLPVVVDMLLLAAFIGIMYVPLLFLGKRLLSIVQARRPALVAEVHRVIFEDGLFEQLSKDLIEEEDAKSTEVSESFIKPLLRMAKPSTKAREILIRLRSRAMKTLRKGDHSAYFDFARRPLGMHEIETAVLLAIVQELQRQPEGSIENPKAVEALSKLQAAE